MRAQDAQVVPISESHSLRASITHNCNIYTCGLQGRCRRPSPLRRRLPPDAAARGRPARPVPLPLPAPPLHPSLLQGKQGGWPAAGCQSNLLRRVHSLLRATIAVPRSSRPLRRLRSTAARPTCLASN